MLLIRRHPLLSYFLLAYILTWSVEIPVVLASRGLVSFHLPQWLEALAAVGPFAAAVFVLRVTRGSVGVRGLVDSVLRWKVPGAWFAAAVLSPFAIMFAALFLTGETGRLLSGDLARQIIAEGRLLEILILGGVFRGLGEEPGWRGYALEILRGRHGPLLATLILWPVWTCWHLPVFLMRPEFVMGAWIGFSFGILAATAWSTLLYDKTRSVLMIVIWHALINITRSFAGEASTDAFLAFAQITILAGLGVIVYWFVARPGKYSHPAFVD